jgi:hypothetical protein
MMPLANGTSSTMLLNDTSYTPYADDTRLDCVQYAKGDQNSTKAACDYVANSYGVAVSDLINWNPSLNVPGNTSCVLSPKLQYCTQLLSVISPAITDACSRFEVASPDLDCYAWLRAWSMDSDDLYAWNPDVGPNCTNYKQGEDLLKYKEIKRIVMLTTVRIHILCSSNAFQASRLVSNTSMINHARLTGQRNCFNV